MAFELVSATVAAVDRQPSRTIVSLTNGTSVEFTGSWDDFVASVDAYFHGWSSEVAIMLGLARWIARNPTGANPNTIVGKTVTVDVGVANIENVMKIV